MTKGEILVCCECVKLAYRTLDFTSGLRIFVMECRQKFVLKHHFIQNPSSQYFKKMPSFTSRPAHQKTLAKKKVG